MSFAQLLQKTSNTLYNTTSEDFVSQFLPLLLQQENCLIFVKDEQYRIVYANEAFLSIYPPERRASIIGTTTIEAFPEAVAKVFLAEDRKAFETGRSELIEESVSWNGQARVLNTQKIRFVDSTGQRFILGICHDITVHAAHETELAQKNLALENYAAVAAHDLRSPLATISTGLEFLLFDERNKLTPRSRQFIEMMRSSCDGLMQQIVTLLTVYREQKDRNSMVNRSSVDIKVVLREVQQSLNSLIHNNNAHILSNDITEIPADKTMLRQLFSNLIENSIKYRSIENPIIIIRHEERVDHHQISVEDNGRGINSDKAHDVFGQYSTSTDASKGVGIGLSLCRQIVEWHNGRIWVDKDYTKGCRICFTISKSAL